MFLHDIIYDIYIYITNYNLDPMAFSIVSRFNFSRFNLSQKLSSGLNFKVDRTSRSSNVRVSFGRDIIYEKKSIQVRSSILSNISTDELGND